MIRTENGDVEFNGTIPELAADTTVIVNSLVKMFKKDFPEELANRLTDNLHEQLESVFDGTLQQKVEEMNERIKKDTVSKLLDFLGTLQ